MPSILRIPIFFRQTLAMQEGYFGLTKVKELAIEPRPCWTLAGEDDIARGKAAGIDDYQTTAWRTVAVQCYG